MRGDIIVAANGKPVDDVEDLHRHLADWPIAEPLVLGVIRWQERKEISVIPVEMPDQVSTRQPA
ncbi:MAG TPA: hypothetical protein VMU02_03480 [bacterium]|nr:hypothetical protein [bacterium]